MEANDAVKEVQRAAAELERMGPLGEHAAQLLRAGYTLGLWHDAPMVREALRSAVERFARDLQRAANAPHQERPGNS